MFTRRKSDYDIDNKELKKILDSYKQIPTQSNFFLELFKAKCKSKNFAVDIAVIAYNLIKKYKTVVNLENTIVENSRKWSFGYFIISIFKDVQLNWHHIEWFGMIEDDTKNDCILASRGLGKTFMCTELYFCWKAFRCNKNSQISQFKQNSGLIFSQNQKFANKKLEKIKRRIEDNPILKEELLNDKDWAKEGIITKNGYELHTYGIDSGSRGGHVYHIVLDDILEKNALYSADYREKLDTTFKGDIIPQLLNGGKMIIIGTPMHNDDIYGRLRSKIQDNNLNFRFSEYPAIYPNGRYTWKWQLTEEYLKNAKILQGELLFAQEFLCKPLSESSSIFPYKILNNAKDYERSYINSIQDFDLWEQTFYVISGTDFAKSASASADNSSHLVVAVTEKRHIYLLYRKSEKGMSYYDQMGTLKNIEYFFKPNLICLESNGFQEIFKDNFEQEYSLTRVKGFKTGRSKNDFLIGIPAIECYFSTNKIHFPYKTEEDKKITDGILAQFNSITFTDTGLKAVSGHDDDVFAFYIVKQGIDEIDKDFKTELLN